MQYIHKCSWRMLLSLCGRVGWVVYKVIFMSSIVLCCGLVGVLTLIESKKIYDSLLNEWLQNKKCDMIKIVIGWKLYKKKDYFWLDYIILAQAAVLQLIGIRLSTGNVEVATISTFQTELRFELLIAIFFTVSRHQTFVTNCPY